MRANRLDGDDKEFGHIVDYKDLFKNVEKAISVYTKELDTSSGGADSTVLMQDRLTKGRERLDLALEQMALLIEHVPMPKDELAHIRYFCGNTEIETDLKEREPLRAAYYKGAVSLLRAYANIADEMQEAGYSTGEAAAIKQQIDGYVAMRDVIRRASNETIDLKAYEADMRHLIDTYIEARAPRVISPFDGMGLLDVIVNAGIDKAVDTLPDGVRKSKDAVAETIANNVRATIIKSHLTDPAYYDRMSALLNEVIAKLRDKAIAYEEYLRQIAELAREVRDGPGTGLPPTLDTAGKKALYNNLGSDEAMALAVHAAIVAVRKADWRGNAPKEREIKGAINRILKDKDEVERVFAIVRQQGEY